MNKTDELLYGAYDLHMHAAPSPFNRELDDQQLLREAGKAGMAGILLKSHYEPTIARAELANKYVCSTAQAFGTVALNWPVGGINPYAAANALKRGARIIFMPTRDAANSLVFGNMPGDFFNRTGLTVFTENRELIPQAAEILDVVKEYDAVLATGHLSPEESLALCNAAIQNGTRTVLTHPEFTRTKIDARQQKKLAQNGVFIEKCWYNIAEGECSAEEMAQTIRAVGAEHCFMSTDRGQKGREHPVEAMKMFIKTLMDAGITEDEIFVMTHTVPEQILAAEK